GGGGGCPAGPAALRGAGGGGVGGGRGGGRPPGWGWGGGFPGGGGGGGGGRDRPDRGRSSRGVLTDPHIVLTDVRPFQATRPSLLPGEAPICGSGSAVDCSSPFSRSFPPAHRHSGGPRPKPARGTSSVSTSRSSMSVSAATADPASSSPRRSTRVSGSSRGGRTCSKCGPRLT